MMYGNPSAGDLNVMARLLLFLFYEFSWRGLK
jgi:hypothetical protein